MALKCIPLNPAWTGDTKLDLRAIYRRPNGDITTALPLRRHHSWEAKGLTYVTLADYESFAIAVPFLRASGYNPQEFVAGMDGDGRATPWNADTYSADTKATLASAEADLKALIAEFGVEQVEKIKGITVPAHLRPEPETVKVGAAKR